MTTQTFNAIIHKLTKAERKELLEKLKEQYGIKEIDGELIKIGAERIRLFTGELEEKEYESILSTIWIEGIGVSILKEEKDGWRISIEGAQALKEQITKNISELEDKNLGPWMHGEDIQQKNEQKGFVVMKNKNDLLGAGKLGAEKVSNYIPKERRLKHK